VEVSQTSDLRWLRIGEKKMQKPQGLKRMSASATQGGRNKLSPPFFWLSYTHRTFHGHSNGQILREKSEKRPEKAADYMKIYQKMSNKP